MEKKQRRKQRSSSTSPSQEARRLANRQLLRSPSRRKRGTIAGLDALTVVIIALVAIGVIAVIGLLLYQQGREADLGRQVPLEEAVHVEDGSVLEYQNYPPSSGAHYPAPYRWGVFTEEVPEGRFVHNLEHGGIVILYKCDGPCPELERSLADLYQTFPPSRFGNVKLIVSPYSKLNNLITALSWGWVLELNDLDRDRLLRFYEARVDKGPEQVP